MHAQLRMTQGVSAAATLTDHIRNSAPAGVQVWHEGTVVAVLRTLDSLRAATEWASALRAGMEGRMFNLEFRQTEEIRSQ